jgi:hypothetical protein
LTSIGHASIELLQSAQLLLIINGMKNGMSVLLQRMNAEYQKTAN